MKVSGVIPARYSSTRLPGKPLADICGKPMVQHVYENAAQAKLLDEVLVATDDERVYRQVIAFGGQAIMTSPNHATGTDRLAEVATQLDSDVLVNIQGDEPLLMPQSIDKAISALLEDDSVVMSTLKWLIKDLEEAQNPSAVKVVTDNDDNALYFSRAPIPYPRDGSAIYYKHLGLYVYRKEFLLHFASLAPTALEDLEKLEQLRVLENGYKIKVVETEHDSIGVDTPADLDRVRQIIGEKQSR